MRLSALFIMILVLTCCGSNSAASNTAGDAAGSSASTQIARGLAELEHLSAPDGCDSELFAELKDSLAAQLTTAEGLAVCEALSSQDSQVTNLIAYQTTEGNMRLAWSYRNQGDYDQNSEVCAQDLVTIGQHFGYTPAHPFWNISRHADGDSNGEINSSDIVPIAQYFGNRLDQYNVQSSPDGTNNWTDAGTVRFSESSLQSQGGARRFAFETSAEAGTYWRVVPMEAEQAGITSTAVIYNGDPVPCYSASGCTCDQDGMPLAGVQISLDDSTPILTGADGTYAFPGIEDGTTATVSASAPGLMFLPAKRGLTVDGGNAEALDFTGFAASTLQTDLPAQAYTLSEITFQIQVLGVDNQPLTGFHTEAHLTSEPAGMQIIARAWFYDGVAQVHARFSHTGDYVVNIAGLGANLDGVLGSVQVVDPEVPEVSIPTWGNDADAAISLTFDDGTADHWQRGLPMWEEYGFTVTLGIISSMFPEERIPQLAQALVAGHELANHTATHPDMATFTPEQQRQELQACNDFLIDSVPGLDYVPTVIYPYESFDNTVMETLDNMGFMFARSGYQGIVDYAELNDPWNPPLLHLYSWANLNTLPVSMWNDTTDWAVDRGGWLVEQCHGIGTEGEPGVGWNPRPEAEYREHYEHIASFGDRIWVAPIGTVGAYLIERNCAQVNVTETSAGHLEFSITTGLELPVKAVPLTIRLTKPTGWDSIYARQNGKPLSVTTYTRDETEYFRFDVTPDSGKVSVTR